MRNATIHAESATGWNRFRGQSRYRWDFIQGPLADAGAHTAGIHDPNNTEPQPITADTPDDAVLATIVDPFLEVVFPGFQATSANPDGINVPLRQVASFASSDLSTRSVLPYQGDAPTATRAQAEPRHPEPITLGEWCKASGKMKLRCRADGTASLKIKVQDLIPNRAYTVWAMWYRADGSIFPQPFGGAPNAYITDPDGDASFERELNFCPLTAAEEGIDGHRLLSIITHLHSDHILYGPLPTPTGTGYPPGTVLHMQLEWNFPGVGTRLID